MPCGPEAGRTTWPLAAPALGRPHPAGAAPPLQGTSGRRPKLADGCGRLLHPDTERVAAAEELVALTLPELARLGVLALLIEGWPEPGPPECATALSRNGAEVLRLVDRAIAAHGRDNDYPVAAWLDHAVRSAGERARVVSTFEAEELPVGMLVEATAEALADVVMALHRDRLGVPEGLADALGSLLNLYAAGAGAHRLS